MRKNLVHRLLSPLLLWRLRHINNRVYLILVSVLVGLMAGLTAVILKSSVHRSQELLYSWVPEEKRVFAFFLYPIIGIALSVLFNVGAIFGLVWLASRVYRVGMLMYGKRATIPEVWKWIRQS